MQTLPMDPVVRCLQDLVSHRATGTSSFGYESGALTRRSSSSSRSFNSRAIPTPDSIQHALFLLTFRREACHFLAGNY